MTLVMKSRDGGDAADAHEAVSRETRMRRHIVCVETLPAQLTGPNTSTPSTDERSTIRGSRVACSGPNAAHVDRGPSGSPAFHVKHLRPYERTDLAVATQRPTAASADQESD